MAHITDTPTGFMLPSSTNLRNGHAAETLPQTWHPAPYATFHTAGNSGGNTSAARLTVLSAIGAAALQGFVAARKKSRRAVQTRLVRADGENPEAASTDLASEAGMDYTKLKDLLSDGDFKEADAETRRLLVELGGNEAVKRGWVYFAEVRAIPATDIATIDNLWQEHSGGKFGYSKQRKFWRQCRGDFAKFAEKVSWFTGKWENRNWPDEFIYDTSAPEGHLPLTNCIRGAQVLQELMEHSAFEPQKKR
mmetsp:Transcript_22771/g.51993  ORF Transcript_22771/g.51993 Transcript_22771/m.51993 type:complete len:250 (+) Transcript_22771:78-827(+)